MSFIGKLFRVGILINPHSKNCHSKNFGTRDLRQANLPQAGDLSLSPSRATRTYQSPSQRPAASPPLSPSVTPPPQTPARKGTLFATPIGRKDTGNFGDSANSPGPLLRPTRVLSPTRTNFVANTEQIDDTDNTEEDEGEDLQFTPSHTGRSEGGLPRTVPLAGTPTRADSPTKRPPPATLGRALSIGGNGGTGTRRVVPLVASSTGTRYGAALAGELRSTPTGGAARKWGSSPQCPGCSKSVYFAEQVRLANRFRTLPSDSQSTWRMSR
jgi:hypothetical protein